ncbi:hypothetical protein D3C76_1021560 [compost metagenome]
MAPGIGRCTNAVVALFHFHHHGLDGDDGIIHQQPEREDQGTKRDPVKVAPRGQHDDKDRRQRKRHGCGHHQADAPAQAKQAHRHDHAQRDKELEHELTDSFIDVDRLIGNLRQGHAHGHCSIDCRALLVQRPAQLEPVPALSHHHPEQKRLLAIAPDQK